MDGRFEAFDALLLRGSEGVEMVGCLAVLGGFGGGHVEGFLECIAVCAETDEVLFEFAHVGFKRRAPFFLLA